MTPQDFIQFAWAFDGLGGGAALDASSITQALQDKQLAWIHLDATHPQTRPWLKSSVTYLDDIVLDALMADETRPRVFAFDEGLLLILRGVNLNEGAAPQDMISIRLWIDPYRIISLERRPLKAIRDLEQRLQTGKGPNNAGAFLAFLTRRLFDRMQPALDTLDDDTDSLEEHIITTPQPGARQAIVNIRKQAIVFRRYIAPQRDVMQFLRLSDLPWLSSTDKRHFQESHDQLIRYIEDLDSIRERAQVIKDELVNSLSDRLNKNMYTLSVIAAIFLPLGFLTGLLGINVGGIPGSENPQAFWLFVAGLAALILVQVIIFKKLRWF